MYALEDKIIFVPGDVAYYLRMGDRADYKVKKVKVISSHAYISKVTDHLEIEYEVSNGGKTIHTSDTLRLLYADKESAQKAGDSMIKEHMEFLIRYADISVATAERQRKEAEECLSAAQQKLSDAREELEAQKVSLKEYMERSEGCC